MAQKPSKTEEPNATSLPAVMKHTLITLVILVSAILTEWLRQKFGSVSSFTETLLIVMESTLIIWFVVEFFIALTELFRVANKLRLEIVKSSSWDAVSKYLTGTPDKAILIPVVLGMITSILIFLLFLLVFVASSIPIGWLAGGLVVVILFASISLVYSIATVSQGAFASTVGAGAIGCLIVLVISVFLAFVGLVALILQLTGQADKIHEFINILYQRK